MIISHQCKEEQVWTTLSKMYKESTTIKITPLLKEKTVNDLHFYFLSKQCLSILKTKGGMDPTYPDTISLCLWLLQYRNF